MKRTIHFSLVLLGALALLTGCHKQDADPGPAAPLAGIAGAVYVADQADQPLPREGVTVTVLNASPQLTATTDAAGAYALPDVPAGTYRLSFSRPGLSTFYLGGVAHASSTPTRLESFSLRQEPDVQATGLALAPAQNGPGVSFRATLSSPRPTDIFRYVLYVSDSPGVGLANAKDYFWQASGGATPATGCTSDFALTRAQLLSYGVNFASGTPVYAVAHGTGLWSSGYTDPATGIQLVWPNCNRVPSPVVRFTMP